MYGECIVFEVNVGFIVVGYVGVGEFDVFDKKIVIVDDLYVFVFDGCVVGYDLCLVVNVMDG